MNYNIIGAGRLGKNICQALHDHEIAELSTVCNRTLQSAKEAVERLGFGQAEETLAQLPPVDLTWITANDDAILSLVNVLSQNTQLKPGSIVAHCSGVLTSEILAPLRQQGCFVASIHPLKAFRAGYLNAHAFNGVDCVMEGDLEATLWLSAALTQLGANIITIKPEAKAAYHAAATMASNYLLSLASCSEQLFLQAGIEQEQAHAMICKLMQGNIDNLRQTKSITASLTGPLMRGDNKTLALHLQNIKNPETARLYKAAGLALLPLTGLSDENRKMIIDLID